MLDDYLRVADASTPHDVSRDTLQVYERFPPQDVSGKLILPDITLYYTLGER